MIIACPSCATEYALPERTGSDATVMRCSVCGHGWIEALAVDVSDSSDAASSGTRPTGHAEEYDPRVAAEARKIVRAAQVAEQKARVRHRRRMAQAKGWAGLAAGVVLVLAAIVAIPERIVQAAPAAAQLYALAGKPVNVRGFVISQTRHKALSLNAQSVLALSGTITNVTDMHRRVPAIRFVLRDVDGKQLHAWTLHGVATKALPPGASSGFVTRLAAPPQGVESVEIRFARDGEIG